MMQGNQGQDEMDFDIVNQETGDLLGQFAVTMSTSQWKSFQLVNLLPWVQGGDFWLEPTSTPTIAIPLTECDHFDEPTIITLHSF